MLSMIMAQVIGIKKVLRVHRLQKLCEEGRIEGVQRFGRFWMIPKEAQKPADLRKNRKGRSDISHV